MTEIKGLTQQEINLESNKKKTYKFCSYCNYYYEKSKVMKCSFKDCELNICRTCSTFIDDKPFCPSCVLEIVRHKSLLIITKGDF